MRSRPFREGFEALGFSDLLNPLGEMPGPHQLSR
jgi:hypothetical protein